MIRVKSRLRKKAKATGDWDTYKQHQKECKKAFCEAEMNYINNSITEGLKNNNSKPYLSGAMSRVESATKREFHPSSLMVN